MVNEPVMMHKCFKGLHLATCQKFSTRAIVHDRQTRYRDIQIIFFNAGQCTFYYHGVKIWNNLSKDLRDIINTKVLTVAEHSVGSL